MTDQPPDPTDPTDLAADPAERAALGALADALRRGTPTAEPPPELRARTLAALPARADHDPADAAPEPASPGSTDAWRAERGATHRGRATGGPRRRRRGAHAGSRARRRPRGVPVLAAVGVAAVAVLIAGAVVLTRPAGTLEARVQLAGAGGVGASAEVREIGIGRTVDLDSESLPILPEGEYYEVWFVGPRDRRGAPQRVSAGTFHPDAAGRSEVMLKAAADPAKLPVLEVTAEPGDGDPRASGRVVLRADVR